MRCHWQLRQHFIGHISPQLREAHGLDMPEVFLLHYIRESSLSPGEIAAAMLLPPHTISRWLERLEQQRYITRSLDPDDARRRVLSVTPAGERVLDAALERLDQAVGALLSRLEPEKRRQLVTLLEQLTEPETRA